MYEEQKEAFEAVNKINEELAERYRTLDQKEPNKCWLAMQPMLTIAFTDYITNISLSIPSFSDCIIPEFELYNSENDDRIFYEEYNKYEDFYVFIKRKFEKMKNEIRAIKL